MSESAAPTMLPPAIRAALESVLGVTVTGVQVISGGQVSETVRADTSAGPLFVKWQRSGRDRDAAAMFACEADGLQALGENGALRVPAVRLVSADPPFLVLQFIPQRPIEDADAFSRRFAQGLATLHRETRADTFGYARDNFLGAQPQRNQPRTTDWLSFYRDYRLIPQIGRAIDAGLMPQKREWALMDLLNALPRLLADLPPEASLIHGDLWSGNFLCATGDRPVVIDPAVYYAPREMEIAYVELFGGFPPRFVEHYHDEYPLDSGYARRRSLHQLYPLLVHLNHFGETYSPAIDRVCREYVSG